MSNCGCFDIFKINIMKLSNPKKNQLNKTSMQNIWIKSISTYAPKTV